MASNKDGKNTVVVPSGEVDNVVEPSAAGAVGGGLLAFCHRSATP